MAPSEQVILTNYLLVPARLTDITTFEAFKNLFPRASQSSPHIKSLFRDLQHQRNAVVETVEANIAAEAKNGAALRREVIKARKEAQDQGGDEELEIERALFGADSGLPSQKHTLNSIIPEMDNAVTDMEAEIKALEDKETALLESIRQTIGGLSDLRYGKLENANLKDDILQSLQAFQEECRQKT